jgi:hypothetical protein
MKQKNLKFTSIVMRNGFSSTIFATNGMYMNISYFVGFNMLIQHVITFYKILLPFSFIKSTCIKNSRCLFGLWIIKIIKIIIIFETNLLCNSQQEFETKFASLDWCDVKTMNAF